MITKLRIVPFIVTLGMLGIARGLAKYLAGEQKVDAPGLRGSTGADEQVRGRRVAHGTARRCLDPARSWPRSWDLVLRNSVLGTHTFAIGSNENTARLCGVPVQRTKVAIYVPCAACSQAWLA